MVFKKLFKKKKQPDLPLDENKDLERLKTDFTPPQPRLPEKPLASNNQSIQFENIRTKLDTIMMELNNIKIQNQTMSEKIKDIEKTLVEMRGIKYY